MALLLPLAGALLLAEPIQASAEWLKLQVHWTAPLVILAAGLLAGFALLPTHAISLAAGYVYGMALGLPVALLAVVIAAAIGNLAARRLSGAQLRAWVDARPMGRRLAATLIDARGLRAVAAITLVRLPPQVPFALANVLAAMLRVRPGVFLTGTLMGMAPRVALVVWLGSELAVWDPTAAPPGSLLLALAAALVGFLGLGLLAWRALRPTQAAAAATA